MARNNPNYNGNRNQQRNNPRSAPQNGRPPRAPASNGGNFYARKPFRNSKPGGTPSGFIEPGNPDEFYEASGALELHPNNYGFLRSPENDYRRVLSDPFIPGSMIEKYKFREGVLIHGLVQPATKNQGPRLREIIDVDGLQPDEFPNIKPFDERTPINPEEWLRLETGPEPLTTRVMDILTPLGKGQRALIVAPPRSGKTILLHHISQAIVKNHPDVKVIILQNFRR
ncbi:hypothetical protein FACS18942_09790 [Planctomycetales bacterium]|nr:hypothetical protein FACS18942_09790 [Planctomycetales bacterium]